MAVISITVTVPKPFYNPNEAAQVAADQSRFVQDILTAMQRYPPQRPPAPRRRGNRTEPRKARKRTGTLKANWRQTRKEPGLVEVRNQATDYYGRQYASKVQGAGGEQAWMHQGHWQQIDEEAQKVWDRHKPVLFRILSGR